MVLNPSVIALLTSSLLITFLVVYASIYGLRIARNWDLSSGAELQLDLEKRTYLVSTLMTYTFSFELFSLFLFIFTADDLHHLFTGAMCAAGTLNVNAFGYPAMLVKILNCLLAGFWLVMNYADSRAFDYPLIRKKYLFLLFIAPSILLETFLQSAFFWSMKPHVITSCCGSLFNTEKTGVAAGIAALPHIPMAAAFFGTIVATLLSGILFLRRGERWKVGILFSLLSLATFFVSVAALISFICLYFYELPTHHCPFCILQKEYHYAGYALYILPLIGAIAGGGVGILTWLGNVPSLKAILPPIQRKLAASALIAFALLLATVIYKMIFSNLALFHY
jgi:hypothetical protein